MINEKEYPEIADTYDYYYVPTFYLDGKKVHEGACSKQIVLDIMTRAIA